MTVISYRKMADEGLSVIPKETPESNGITIVGPRESNESNESTAASSNNLNSQSAQPNDANLLAPPSRPPIQTQVSEHHGVYDDKKSKMFLYMCTSLSAIGGFLFGYDTGIVSGAMVFVNEYFNLTPFWTEMIITITIIAAWMFSLFGGYLADKIGRKRSILIGSVTFAAGSVMLAVAQDKVLMLVGRYIVGIAIGLASAIVPMYISEVAPTEVRGSLTALQPICVAIGQFIACLIAGGFSSDPVNGWRWMLGLAAVPGVIQFVGFIFMPESPRWLVKVGREDEARKILYQTRKDEEVEEELAAIVEDVVQTKKDLAARQLSRQHSRTSMIEGHVWFRVLRIKAVRRALVLGCMLQIINQVSGINTIIYYAATIIRMSGVEDNSKAVWLTSILGAVSLVANSAVFPLVERIGRRFLILISLIGVTISLMLIAGFFWLSDINSTALLPAPSDFSANHTSACYSYSRCVPCTGVTECGFCYQLENDLPVGYCLPINDADHGQAYNNWCSSQWSGEYANFTADKQVHWQYDICPATPDTAPYSIVIIISMGLYLFFYGIGMYSVVWVINGEIFPLWARSFCFAVSTSFNWFLNIGISLTFLTLSEAITRQGTFLVYAVLALVGFVWFYLTLPETKGINLEQVEQLFSKGWIVSGPHRHFSPFAAAKIDHGSMSRQNSSMPNPVSAEAGDGSKKQSYQTFAH